MLSNLPLPQPFSLLRPFGSDSELFRVQTFQNQPVLGHTGIDLAAPAGTPISAAAAGLVLRAGMDTDTDSAGFGGYVLLHHPWGQTLYARLENLQVRQGMTVAAGHHLGDIAPMPHADNQTRRAHFHFGLRIVPYSLTDGWAGFTDPAPYLARIQTPRGPLIGPHIIATIRPHLPTLARWQPRLILVLDPNAEELAELRAACPQSTIIARIYTPEHELEQRIRTNPQQAAQWAHEQVLARWSPHVDYWQIANEILQNAAGLPLLNQFEVARMALADQHGYKCAILAFSVGNPDLPSTDRMAHWRLVYPALEHAQRHAHCVAVHQYGMPTLWGPDNAYDWYIHRLEHQVLPRLPFKRLQFAVTEFGIDGLIRGSAPAGWKAFSSPETYAAQLLKANRYLERFSGRVLGYTIFTLGHYPPWGSYDIAGTVAELLAEQLDRGTWSAINITVTDIVPKTGDTTYSPGPEALPPPDPSEGDIEPGEDEHDEESPDTENPDTENPEDENPEEEPGEDETGESEPVTPVRRLAPPFTEFNYHIATLDQRPDQPTGDPVYIIQDVFFTQHGNWDADSAVPVPDWARTEYGVASFTESGATNHLFGAVLDGDGNLIKNIPVRYWSNGFERLGDPQPTGYVDARTKSESGWVNMPMGAGSIYKPAQGERGPWCYAPVGAAEVLVGGGLPNGQPISTFVVWRAIPRAEWEASQPEDEVPEGEVPEDEESPKEPEPEQPEPEDPTPPVKPGKPTIELVRRVSPWIAHYNMGYTKSLQAVAARPGRAADDILYIVKDLFTTRNGSWEPDGQPGSIPVWARDAYLRPLGAPDYFDDAGGDHHLFAAVIGLDGTLLPELPVAFWSDGLDAAAQLDYAGYVMRSTKTRSRWANIVIGPGSSFVPERGESGPWCWAPVGEAEVAFGGGLPANHHISTFVVWQAVRRADLFPPSENEEETDDETNDETGERPDEETPEEEKPNGDYSIFFPVIVR